MSHPILHHDHSQCHQSDSDRHRAWHSGHSASEHPPLHVATDTDSRLHQHLSQLRSQCQENGMASPAHESSLIHARFEPMESAKLNLGQREKDSEGPARFSMEKRPSFAPSPAPREPGQYHSSSPSRYRCCCVKLTRRIVLCITILGALLGLLAFFLFPRLPHVVIESVKQTTPPEDALQVVALPNAVGHMVNMTASFDITVRVNSSNYIPWHLDRINAQGYYHSRPMAKANATLIGNGTVLFVTIASRASTAIVLPFRTSYSSGRIDASQANPSGMAADPVLTDLMNRCSPLSADKTIKVNFELTLYIPFLSLLGIKPTISHLQSLPCPFTESQMGSLIGQLIIPK